VSIFFRKSVAIFGLFTVHFGKSVRNFIKIDCISLVTFSLLFERAPNKIKVEDKSKQNKNIEK